MSDDLAHARAICFPLSLSSYHLSKPETQFPRIFLPDDPHCSWVDRPEFCDSRSTILLTNNTTSSYRYTVHNNVNLNRGFVALKEFRVTPDSGIIYPKDVQEIVFDFLPHTPPVIIKNGMPTNSQNPLEDKTEELKKWRFWIECRRDSSVWRTLGRLLAFWKPKTKVDDDIVYCSDMIRYILVDEDVESVTVVGD
ncbi:hypothetical protein SISSUDRAFT_1133598 [Sistotremastrum suecicum HHB10207 ss-3]|uniref:MSP domain-containing protein n=1 Tax=Sistotremastrum suecicum HHB10207 ss-3 TaxID=1314776 RepID=A0A165WPE2_9AGAM|nr:hypothetical protein SISSUDRAFT_1133598 [Sistotremastrum suecicum HHB10207 ss-3]